MTAPSERGAFTCLVRIRPERVKKLSRILAWMGDHVAGTRIRFRRMETVHFLRWAILPLGNTPRLAFESNFDGPLRAHLDDLLAAGLPTLAVIYAQCGYEGGISHDNLRTYLMRHQCECNAFYRAYRGWTAAQISEDARARGATAVLLERQPDASKEAVAIHLRACGVLPPAHPPPARSPLFRALAAADKSRWTRWVVRIPGLLALLPLLAVWILSGLCGGRPTRKAYDGARLELREDVTPQNQLSHVVEVKPGILRLWMLKRVLSAIDVLAEHYFIEGNLGGIDTIHFARWFLVDDRWLIFFSNYDGSWESYLGQFIDRLSSSLNAIWGRTQGFPACPLPFWGGANDEQSFKQWARDHQVPSQIWYCAHPGFDVRRIWDSARLCNALASAAAGEEYRELV
jgi:hypothetical protein